jgi:hypothetical protein
MDFGGSLWRRPPSLKIELDDNSYEVIGVMAAVSSCIPIPTVGFIPIEPANELATTCRPSMLSDGGKRPDTSAGTGRVEQPAQRLATYV